MSPGSLASTRCNLRSYRAACLLPCVLRSWVSVCPCHLVRGTASMTCYLPPALPCRADQPQPAAGGLPLPAAPAEMSPMASGLHRLASGSGATPSQLYGQHSPAAADGEHAPNGLPLV